MPKDAPSEDTLSEVTSEQFAEIRTDLEKLLKVKQKSGEPLVDYATRLAKGASDPAKVDDDAWETLAEQTQRWVNAANIAIDEGGVILLPDDADGDAVVGAEEDAAEEEEKAPAQSAKAKSAKSKAELSKAGAAPAGKAGKKVVQDKKAPAKEAAPGKKKSAGRRGPRGKFSTDSKIKSVVKDNPFRDGTIAAGCFKHYKVGATVAAVLAKVPRSKFARHVKRGVVTLA